MATAIWAPNQAAIAQTETYTFSAPSGVGNWYQADINGKTVRYASVSGDTAATAATALFNLLNASASVPAELLEVQFANPSAGVVTATARTPGVPFANVTVNGVAGQGLVLSTGNGLVSGIATAHTTANASPSDVNDPQNWLRVTAPAPGVRQLPQNGDDEMVANSSVPMLWNLDRLAAVQRNSYARWQSFTGTVGLPENNPGGYAEWRATYYKMSGPTGSAPAGGLPVVLGYSSGSGSGPSRERYDLGSSRYTCTVLAAGGAQDEYGIRLLGVHTDNVVQVLNGASVGVAMLPGETSKLNSVAVSGGATLAAGPGVTWATSIFGAASSCAAYGGSLLLNSAPAALNLTGGAQFTAATDALTWPSIAAQGGCGLSFLAGGVITSLTMTTGCVFDKSGDPRSLVITSATIDGDSCSINDPLNTITYTNPVTVKQQVGSGPFSFTGSRTVRVI